LLSLADRVDTTQVVNSLSVRKILLLFLQHSLQPIFINFALCIVCVELVCSYRLLPDAVWPFAVDLALLLIRFVIEAFRIASRMTASLLQDSGLSKRSNLTDYFDMTAVPDLSRCRDWPIS
jgi:hypothetical protein